MSEGRSGDRPRRRASGPFRLFPVPAVIVVVAALVLAATFNLGVGNARRLLLGGYFNTVARDMTVGIGIVATVLLGVLAFGQRRRRPRAAVFIVVALAAGWIGWAAGYTTSMAEGYAADYAGSARISAGSQVLGSIPIGCSSVVGDPGQLAGFAVRTNGFQVNLRNPVDRAFQPGISGEAILSGATVSFGTVAHGADATGFVPIDEVLEDGLAGHATVPAVVTSGSSAVGADVRVTIEWACGPANNLAP